MADKFEIDPVEFGEMRRDVRHTRSDVKYIREKLEPRVRKLENWRSFLLGLGALGAVGSVITLIAKFIL